MDDGSHAIVIHLGFTLLIYYFSRAIARVAIERDGSEVEPAAVHTAALDIAEVAWWHRLTDRAPRPSSEVSPLTLHLASELSGLADAFYVGHELGHVCLEVLGTDQVAHSFPELPTRNMAYRIEHVCDGIGLATLIKTVAAGVYGPVYPPMAVASGELVLRSLALLERLGFPVAKSHPAAIDRLSYLRRVATESLNTDAHPVADKIGEVFSDVQELFAESGQVNEGDNHTIERLVEWLDEVFEALPNAEPEDLHPIATSVFGNLDPAHLTQAMARALIREISDPDDRIALNPDVQARLGAIYTDQEIGRMVRRQEVLLSFFAKYVKGNLRDAMLMALGQNMSELNPIPDELQ